MAPQSRDDFTLGIICALQLETNAVKLVLDELYTTKEEPLLGKSDRDHTGSYLTGRIKNHNVVLVTLPRYAKKRAQIAAADLVASFPNIHLVFVVGICGALPTILKTGEEVLMGDVIISTSIVQYDLGAQFPHVYKIDMDRALPGTAGDIVSLIKSLNGDKQGFEDHVAKCLTDIQRAEPKTYRFLGIDKDFVFPVDYLHLHRSSDGVDCGCTETGACDVAKKMKCRELSCARDMMLPRQRVEQKKRLEDGGKMEEAQKPAVYFGAIACGNRVVKSGVFRDALGEEVDIIAFEMEGSGVWEQSDVSCMVIKGACDYADSHKKKGWQNWAAATAAAACKAILELSS
ncbi:nucleoside phosphorylase domain-containing protein [Podospora fimiseda]|uniref:Nucleoside phosphorylase domain-containing protein n=1 Tax=Podospora fimiseda TaxID=252190 RepID=A0AAN7BNM0_9PEZI|nr:nucleoside phosphorylase domain-containing protein [Podospora fimiseda]